MTKRAFIAVCVGVLAMFGGVAVPAPPSSAGETKENGPQETSPGVNLLSLMRLPDDIVRGDWAFDQAGHLTTPGNVRHRPPNVVRLPVRWPDLDLYTTMTLKANDTVGISFPLKGGIGLVTFNAGGRTSRIGPNGGTAVSKILAVNKAHKIVVQVRGAAVKVLVDNKLFMVADDASTVEPSKDLPVDFGIVVYNTPVVIRDLRLQWRLPAGAVQAARAVDPGTTPQVAVAFEIPEKVKYLGRDRSQLWFKAMHEKFGDKILLLDGKFVDVGKQVAGESDALTAEGIGSFGEALPKSEVVAVLKDGSTIIRRPEFKSRVVSGGNSGLGGLHQQLQTAALSTPEILYHVRGGAADNAEVGKTFSGRLVSIGTYRWRDEDGKEHELPSYVVHKALSEEEFLAALNSGFILIKYKAKKSRDEEGQPIQTIVGTPIH